jgi:hypothetical protein
MSLAQYGFQKLVLLNSAGYSRAELPLDDSVSIIAPNNTGKTSLINALQFLLIIDRRWMDFGAHSLDNSRRFYFPDNSAYILLEVLLPMGMAVIGCVGKGLSHDYEYFAYQGSLDVDDYRLDSGKLVTQPKLIERLLERGKLAKIYQSSDLRALLYGNRQKQRSDDPDLTIFPLEFTSQAATYQRILTRTLRLDSLDSRQVKDYLLEIYKNYLHDRSVNFKEEWDKSFADVNYDKSQFDAVSRNLERINVMETQHQARLVLRGKLIHSRPLIEQGLIDWESYYTGESQRLQAEARDLEEQFQALETRHRTIFKEQAEVESEKKDLDKLQQRQQDLDLQFQFVQDLAQLQTQLDALQDQRDELKRRLTNAENQQNAASLKRMIDKGDREIRQLEQRIAAIDDNLYLQLQAALSAESFDALIRLLSPSVLSSKVAVHDQTVLRAWGTAVTAHLQGSQLDVAGLTIDLSVLEPCLQLKNAAELQTEIEEIKRQQAEWEITLVTVEQFEEQKSQLADLDQQLKTQRQDIEIFKELLGLRHSEAARKQNILELHEREKDLGAEDRSLGGRKQDNQNAREQIKDNLKQLNLRHSRVHNARQQRKDHEAPLIFLDQLPHVPWMRGDEFHIDQLADQIETYNQDCKGLHELEHALAGGLNALRQEGINKFEVQESPEKALQALFNYTAQLKQEQAAIERKARSAVVQVAAILRDLRDSLETLKSRMAEFNRKINKRPLSDLKVFKIEPREEEAMVNAIRTLISTSEQVDSGQSFDLFDHNTVLDDKALNKAKDLLIKQGEKLGSLRVEHLFRLVFVIGKENQNPAEFDELDSAASNGTVLMAKLITGLAMLNQMQDERKRIKTTCYLDEAASLDQRNQRNLIETAAEFGFALIFASPEPQITARYCVPIGTVNGKNYISRLNWQILEPLSEAIA